jgi:hypothetical protein
VRLDPLAAGELMERGAIEAAREAVIDLLDDGVAAQPGIAQPGGEALVVAMGDLAIDQQAEPIGMGERRAFAGGFEFGEGLGHACEARARRADRGWEGSARSISQPVNGSGGVRGCWGEHRDRLGRR